MNYDQILIERKGYTITDLLSDIGGLQGILISTFSVLISILNSNYLDEFLVAKLFKAESVTLKISTFGENFCSCLIRLLPGGKLACCCPRKRRQKKAMKQAMKSLHKEIDIV